jgi:excisionase family DNA binding protein
MNQTQKLLTVQEFAKELRVTAACIRRWILERRITTVKLGRLVRIPESEANRVIEAGLRRAQRGTNAK